MNNKILIIIGVIVILVILGAVFWMRALPMPFVQNDESAAVRNTVVEFGTKLKMVSLLAPQDQLKTAIEQNYGSFVTEDLLNSWLQDPSKAPGRLTSSPSPDRIEVTSVKKNSDTEYMVEGNIIETTGDNSIANTIPATVAVQKQNNKWLISSFNWQVVQGSFSKQGIITKGTPGLKPGVWYLTYEEPGNPGLRKELDVTGVNLSGKYLYNGMVAKVDGSENNGIIKVSSLQVVNAQKDDLIWVASPLPNQAVTSPLTINGQARGNWYFEASFPVKLLDANGKVLVQAPAQAQGEWMTTNYVPFSLTLTFAKPTTATGTLVLEKDNPSGLPQHANELRIPVRFSSSTAYQPIKLYYYNPNNDKDSSGNIKCSSQGLVAVNRQIPLTQTPIQDTIKLLLQGNVSATEKAQGITTEYPLSGFSLKSANMSNGTLALEFNDPQNKTTGGSCRVAVLWKQIEATAKQFSGVNQVTFVPQTLFQP